MARNSVELVRSRGLGIEAFSKSNIGHLGSMDVVKFSTQDLTESMLSAWLGFFFRGYVVAPTTLVLWVCPKWEFPKIREGP